MNMIDFFDFSLKQKETIQTWNIFDHLIATQSGMSGKCGIKDPLPPSPTRLSLQESTWDLEFQQREAGPAHKNYAWILVFFLLHCFPRFHWQLSRLQDCVCEKLAVAVTARDMLSPAMISRLWNAFARKRRRMLFLGRWLCARFVLFGHGILFMVPF